MLKETYQRDLNHNYMIVQAERADYDSFSDRILQENQIPGFLPCQFRRLDGVVYFYYEISARQSLTQLFHKRKLTEEELYRILMGLHESQKAAESFLLNPDKILYLPQYLYADFNVEHIYCCYYPDYEGDCSLETLGNFFLEHVDYQNQLAVESAYSFHREIMEENVSFGQLLEDLKNKRGIVLEKKAEEIETISPEYPEDNGLESFKTAHTLEISQRKTGEFVKIIKRMLEKFSFSKLFLQQISKKPKQNPYEVNLEIEEPFTANRPIIEATQFFSGETADMHYLIYQGKAHYPDFNLDVFPFVLGKGEKGIDGRIENPMISRIHSQLDYINDVYYITDLNSTNGTFLNGQRLEPHEQVKISPGDRIQFAREPYFFQ